MEEPDLEQLNRELALRKRLQDALLVFSRAVSAKLPLQAALESFAGDLSRLFGTRRVSIWLHERRERLVRLIASSDPRERSAASVSVDEDAQITRALRLDAPVLTGAGDATCLVAPLRGWRRALGTVVMEGAPREVTPQQFVALAGDVTRQLSIHVENLLVLEEAIQRYADYEQMRMRLAQSQKLASLGRSVAGIAHEINNPLQGVLGHLELLLDRVPEDAPDRTTLKRVYSDAERASRIVNNLLAFANTQRTTRQKVDIRKLIDETIQVRETTPHRSPVALEATGAAELPAVLGDASLLQQALLNIIINAEQAVADAKGTGCVTLTVTVLDGLIRVDVDDTGPGIAPDLVPQIFEPFFTTKDVGRGTGLGLAITASIIEAHGGTIAAGAAPAGGARITIQLPATQ